MKDYGSSRPPTAPYQCFMGRWEGLCKTFSPEGEFIESGAVHMDVYWVGETTWRLHEEFERFYPLGRAVIFDTDIHVRGKFCHGEAEAVRLEGTGLTPFNYIFTIWSAVSQTTVYNNHYFLDPNNRRILTHKVREGKTHIFQIQDFVRVLQP
jgi:hypothetical protein